jgi:hypothetical protein
MTPPHDDLTGGSTMRPLDDPTGGATAQPPERLPGGPMARHNLEPVSLIFGFAFTGLGLLFLIGQADQALRVRWIWPVLLLVLGAGILLDVTRNGGAALGPDRVPAPISEPEPDLTPEPDLNSRERPS